MVIDLKEDHRLSKGKVVGASCKGSQRYFITIDGKAAHYQFHDCQWKHTPVDFGFKNSIKSVAVSYNFVLFLNTQGLVYASGDNSKGQLGLG